MSVQLPESCTSAQAPFVQVHGRSGLFARNRVVASARMRARLGAILLAVCGAGCGTASSGPPGRTGTAGRIEPVARELFATLTSGDADRIEALRARDALLGDLFEPGFVDVVLSQRHAEA